MGGAPSSRGRVHHPRGKRGLRRLRIETKPPISRAQASEIAMIELYYWPTPNGHKITLFLEEAGLDYEVHPVNIGTGDQFKPDFLKIAPNTRMPAIIDRAPADGGEPISVFESGAIL